MKKIYASKSLTRNLFLTLACVFASLSFAKAQVSVTATGGSLTGSYTTLKDAFDAINSSVHQGVINITLTANTTEGTTPATLNGNNADPANYTSVTIKANTAVTISGNPGAGFGVIQLYGSSNVTIDGEASKKITVQNTSTATNIGTSVIRVIVNSTTVKTANNISIKNLKIIGNVINYNASGNINGNQQGNFTYGIYFGGGAEGQTNVAAPNALQSTSATPDRFNNLDAAPTGATISGVTIQNNEVSSTGRAIVFNAATQSIGSNLQINNNTVGNSTAGATNQVYTKGIFIRGSSDATVTQNTVYVESWVNDTLTAIDLHDEIGGGDIFISNNTIGRVKYNGTTRGATGIAVLSANNDFEINNNTIQNITANIVTTATSPLGANGILINTTGGIANIYNNKINAIANINTTGIGSAAGIRLFKAANGAGIFNNFISNVMQSGISTADNLETGNIGAGISIENGSFHQILHNSIHLYGSVPANSNATSYACLALNTTTKNLTIKNNIFSNQITTSTAKGAMVGIFMPGLLTDYLTSNIVMNNNAFFTAAYSANGNGMAYSGNFWQVANLYKVSNGTQGFDPHNSAPNTNWRKISTQLGPLAVLNDDHSVVVGAAAPFISNTDLHINTASPTFLESGGVPVGISTDIDAQPRNATWPDIGADEFSGTKDDKQSPYITYNKLPGSFCSTTTGQTLAVTITDQSGIGTATNAPRLYYTVNGGAQQFVNASSVAGSVYTFTFPVFALNDNIAYWVVAQDAASTPNVGSNPSVGSNNYTVNPPAVGIMPNPAYTFVISTALAAGDYLVGSGEPFPFTTLEDAINAYNNSCLGGNIIFTLKNTNYTVNNQIEIFNAEASASKTLTIRPLNVNTKISGSIADGSALFKINGGDYITFDGTDRTASTAKSLTIENTGAGAVIWVASFDKNNGATNNTIKNCVLVGGGRVAGFAVVVQSSGVQMGNYAEKENNNNKYQNNTIKKAYYGIALVGNDINNDVNNEISGNYIGSTTSSEYIGLDGIFIAQQQGVTVSKNEITGVSTDEATTSAAPAAGIYVAGKISGGNISKNKIWNIKNTRALGYNIDGIALLSSTTNTNLTVSNNFIWDVSNTGWSSADAATWSCSGIGIVGTGGGYKLYYNSINMNTAVSNSTYYPGLNNIALHIKNTVGNLDVRNNVFSVPNSNSGKVAIFVETANSVFTNIDYNDYYSVSGNIGYLGSLRANIGAWRIATGKDAHSIDVDPLFISATNLHAQPISPLNHAGVAGTGITTDIDDETRATGSGATAPDIGADEFVAPDCTTPSASGFTITVSKDTICVSETINLTATGYGIGEGIVYNWQSSPDGATWTDIAGATTPGAYSANTTATTFFRLRVTCSGSNGYSIVKKVVVNNPGIATGGDKSRCGFGPVTLTATSAYPINWFDSPTATTPIGSGASFTTNVSATTSFWASATAGGSSGSVGPVSPSAAGGTIGTQTIDWEVYFNVLQPTTLQSIDIFPMTAGQPYTLWVKDNNGNIMHTVNVTTTVSGGATPQTVPINYTFIAPVTGWYLDTDLPSGGVRRNESGASYPYTSSAINITSNGFTSSYYMGMYNWKFSSGCTTNRIKIDVTVTGAPAMTIQNRPEISICSGSDTTLKVNTNAAYTTYQWSLIKGGPVVHTGTTYTVNPTGVTKYYVTAVGASGDAGCRNIDSIVVRTTPVPTDLQLTLYPNSTNYCLGGSNFLLQSNITGGTLDSIYALKNDFNAPTNDWTTVNNTVNSPDASKTDWTLRPDGYVRGAYGPYSSNDASQYYLSDADDGKSGSTTDVQLISPSFSLAGFDTATLSFWHSYTKYTNDIYARVEISTDGGATWVATPLRNYTVTQGARTNFVKESINLNTYLGQTNLKIRFNYKSNWGFQWAIDNVSVMGRQQLSVTWTPGDYRIYTSQTDNGSGANPRYEGGTPYVPGTNAPMVYVSPLVDTTYTAIVTSPAGCSKSKSISVTTINKPVTLTNTSTGLLANYCQGSPINLTALANWPGTNPNSYQWEVISAPAGVTFPGGIIKYTSNVVINGAGDTLRAGTYKIRGKIITNEECAYPIPAFTADTITFTIDSLRPISASISADVTTICVNGTVNFTATGTNTGVNPGYQWQLNGSNIPGATNSTLSISTLNNNDKIRVIITSDEKCTYGKTVTSNEITITVNPSQPVSATISASPGLNICAGTNVTFTANVTNPGTSPTYQWYLNNSPVSGATSSTYSSNTLTDNDKVFVVVTSNIACAINTPANSDTLTISQTGGVPVSVSLSYPGYPGPVCGNSITYTATGVNPGISPVYDFKVNGTTQQSSASNTFTWSVASGDVVSVVLTSSLPCATGNPATATLAAATVNPIPAAPVVTPAGPLAICTGQSATLTSSVSTNITWSPGLQTTPTINVSAAGNYSVTQTVAGCTSPASNVVVVTLKPVPATPTITAGGPTTFCSGSNVNLTSSATSGGATYEWSNALTTQVISATTTGNYTVRHLLNGCYSQPSNSISVTANPKPVVTISGGTNFCGAPVTLTANASGGTITSYQWQLGGGNIAGATAATYNATAIGNYTVVVTNNFTCTTTSAVHTIVNDISPMVGVYTISTAPQSCTNFQSFKAAITALNTRTIAGNVTFNVTPGFVEPALTGTLELGNSALNASVGAYNIIFQKSGAGARPKISAYTGTVSPNNANPDGIWAILGTDNVTIDNIEFEDPNNTAGVSGMEFMIGGFKLSTSDGVQNLTVKNCKITMSTQNGGNGTAATMFEGSKGIMLSNSTRSAATTALTPVSAAGTNSNNKFYSNEIYNGQNGITIYGYDAPAPYTLGDTGNDIGGTSAATGNKIYNYGSSTATAASYACGIRIKNQWSANISWNDINNNDGAGFTSINYVRGIYYESGTDANVEVNHNKVSVKSDAPAVYSCNAIDVNGGLRSSASVSNIVNINYNLIYNCEMLQNKTAAFSAISGPSGAAPHTVNINNNEITNIKLNILTATTAAHTIIATGGGNTTTNGTEFLTTNNNYIHDVVRNDGTTAFRVIYPGTLNFYNWTADGNIIDSIDVRGTGSFDGIASTYTYDLNVTFTNNIIRNLYTNKTGTWYGFRENGDKTGTKIITNNQIYNFQTSSGGATGAAFVGIQVTQGIVTVENNTVHSLNSNGAPGTPTGNVYGIASTGSTVTGSISKNKIYNLSTDAAKTAFAVVGIAVTNSSTPLTIANNYISDLRAPYANTTDAIRGISLASTQNPSGQNVYYNTVYLDASEANGANFGTSAIYATNNGTAAIGTVDMRNNIFYNISVNRGTGTTAAYVRSANAFANYSTSSDYNLFYAGTPSAKNLIYATTTGVADQTIAAFKGRTGIAPREQHSISAELTFVNTTTAPYDLHLDPAFNCAVEGAGNNAGILIPTDFDGDARQIVSPFKTDIGADEFNGPVGGGFVWRGINTNWEDKVNWCTGVPDASSDVIIPGGLTFYPVLTTTTNVAGTIDIKPNATITLNSGSELSISGSLFKVDGTLDNGGKIVFIGNIAQTFPSGSGSIVKMNKLEVNKSGSALTLDRNFKIDGVLYPTLGNITLNNATVTLGSTATATAQVSTLGSGVTFTYSGTGKFVVENYMASSGNAAWRFVSVPTNTTQTIRSSWQEGGNNASTGYGTWVVGPNAAGSGFDADNRLTSLKTYDNATNGYITVPGTNVPVKNDIGYLIFVRGDRSMQTFGPTNNTNLRTEGPIRTGNVAVSGTTAPEKWVPVGNPYPAAINFSTITKPGGFGAFFYVWDPKIGGVSGQGGWQTVVQASPGLFTVTPGGGNYPTAGPPQPIRIQSGQAFLLYASNSFAGGAYTITMHEADKDVANMDVVTRPEGNEGKFLITNVLQGTTMYDGVRVDFDNAYSNAIDIYDAQKAANTLGSIAIESNGKTLAVERRADLVSADTIRLTGKGFARGTYSFEFTPFNIAAPGLEAYLEDAYLNQRTPVSLNNTSRVEFTVDGNEESNLTNRFRIVFAPMRPVPVTFTRVNAVTIEKDIEVTWNVDNEVNIRNYEVQRSIDGRAFETIATVAEGSNYRHLDVAPGTGRFYYRIKSNDISGEYKYSNIVSSVIGTDPVVISVYPNPVKEDRQVNVKISNGAKGEYTVKLINAAGQVILKKKVTFAGGNGEIKIDAKGHLTHGNYNLQVTDPGNTKTIHKIVY